MRMTDVSGLARGMGAATVAVCVLHTAAAAEPDGPWTSHVLNRAYAVSIPPASTYADNTGAEPYAEGVAYRGELTDGKHGSPSYRAGEWVGWRRTYAGPIRVTFDLGASVWVERFVATACGGGASIEPPQRIDVEVEGEQFPYGAFVQIGQMRADAEYVPGPGKVFRFALNVPAFRARSVRLTFVERPWQYLFVDEVQVLGRGAGVAGILPAQSAQFEAEAGQLVEGAAVVDVDGCTGRAVALRTAGSGLLFDLPLPPGDYTIRVRSLAVEPDTFGELLLKHGDAKLRSQPVTNNVFTWQRSHFTQSEAGAARISVALGKGSGAYIDQLHLHELTLGEPITTLRGFTADTVLARDGRALCRIAHDDAGEVRDVAERLAAALAERSGARPAIEDGNAIAERHLRGAHLIALGNTRNNFAILKASPNAWNHIPGPPDDGAPQVHVAVDVRGTGTNTIVLGGADGDQVAGSVAEFMSRLEGSEALSLPWCAVPTPRLETDRARYEELAIESSKWLRQGAIRTLENRWKAYADDLFLMLGYRYIEYKDSGDTIKPISRDGFIEAELFKILCRFDRSEHHGSFTSLQRLQLTNTFLHMSRQCASIFDWECGERKHDPPERTTQILQTRMPRIANNHQTFPVYSILTSGTYFSRYYDVPEAKLWLRWAEMFMQGQLVTSKPQCDCWGYQDITMIHTGRYAAATGRWGYFEREPVHRFLRLRYLSHDNLGGPVGYGDAGAYVAPVDGDLAQMNAQYWGAMTAGRFDTGRVVRQDLLGVHVHALEPLWYAMYGGHTQAALRQCFDKISFRDAFDPGRAYLLLDGLSRGYHGHWDGNSILRFTDNGRVWLCEGDYLKGDPKDHNTMTFMRNAESGRPGLFSTLEARFETPNWGSTVTRTADYCGLDWDRHLLWHRPSDTFLAMDSVRARVAGAYDMSARFRSLGTTQLAGRVWRVEQEGGERFFLHAPGTARLSEARDAEDAKNWKSYAFADPVPALFRQHVAREMAVGDRETLFSVFYAASDTDEPLLEARRASPNALAVRGLLNAVAGVHSLAIQGLRVQATQYVVGPEYLAMVEGTHVAVSRDLLRADAPVSVSLDFTQGTGQVQAAAACSLSLAVPPGARVQVADSAEQGKADGYWTASIPAGRHTLKGDWSALAQAAEQAFEAAWAASSAAEPSTVDARPDKGLRELFRSQVPADITCLTACDVSGDGAAELAVGCADGTLAVLSVTGEELWRTTFAGRVNDLAAADLDADGRAEIVCGVEDENVHVIKPDGTELWKRFFEAHRSQGGIEGHVRVVHVADFDRDGVPEVAVGCASSMFYVLDGTGQVMSSQGRAWEVLTQHKACSIHAADVSGDGQLELLAGYTYFGRKVVDFADLGRSRVSNLGGCISGCASIASADLDGDGVAEAIFADKDGQVTACKKAASGKSSVRVVWRKMIGEDALVEVLAGDFDADGSAEIVLASHSGFLAFLDAAGSVKWVRQAANQVTDAVIVPTPDGRGQAFARSSQDGSVVVYGMKGEELARWSTGAGVQRLSALRATGRPAIAAAIGRELRVAVWEQ